jgi:aryl-alcohol dehydrogenase-like predicted oxidoreductase
MSEPSGDTSDWRALGPSGPLVAPVALGCWPMAGVTTLGATHEDGVATARAALEAGINHFDTAFVYGPNGESDKILAEALAGRREEAVIASKVGVHYQPDDDGKLAMTQDARPTTIRQECETFLKRLDTDHVELLYLHSPDPEVPVAESAGALAELIAEGKIRAAGASNCSLEQIEEFATACPLAAVQLPFNILQRGIEQRTLPWCSERGVAVIVYWALMKGLLAGRMAKDHQLDETDGRRKYPMYQGEEWRKNQQFVDELRTAAELTDVTVAQLVINWTYSQPGITAVLCGAKRPWQIEESVGALGWRLTDQQQRLIDEALDRRGEAETSRSFS